MVFKIGNECFEGRIVGLASHGNSETHTIFSFSTFSEVKVPATEILNNVSQDVKRKAKSSPFLEIPNKPHFPLSLKNVLIIDKEWSQNNKYDLPHKTNVANVLRHFKDFLVTNTGIADLDEVEETIKGFTMCFNMFFKKFLMYESEKAQFHSIKVEPSDFCGPIHLLRLIYFLQKEAGKYITELQTRCVILDYTIYLLDFLVLRYKDYF